MQLYLDFPNTWFFEFLYFSNYFLTHLRFRKIEVKLYPHPRRMSSFNLGLDKVKFDTDGDDEKYDTEYFANELIHKGIV